MFLLPAPARCHTSEEAHTVCIRPFLPMFLSKKQHGRGVFLMPLTHKSARRAGAALRALAASLLLLGGGAHALECPRGQWLAEYFPNITLSGAPVLQRCEKSPIDHYWVGPEGSP